MGSRRAWPTWLLAGLFLGACSTKAEEEPEDDAALESGADATGPTGPEPVAQNWKDERKARAMSGLVYSSGSDSLVADDLTLTLSGLKPSAPALLLAGETRTNVPFGDGRRCIGGTVRRYGGRLADGSGRVTYGAGEIVAFAAAHWGAPLAGQDWSYQGWYRDTLGPCGTGFGLTNAVIVNWKP